MESHVWTGPRADIYKQENNEVPVAVLHTGLFLHQIIVLLTWQYSGRAKTTKSFHVFLYSCVLEYLFNFMLNTNWIFIQCLSNI